jgi:integrase
MNRKKKSTNNKGTRAANGAGSLVEDKKDDGRTYYKYTVTYTDNYGDKYRKTFCGYSEEEYQEKKRIYELQKGLTHEQKTLTLKDVLYAHYYRKYQAGEINEATYLRKKFTIQIIKNSKLSEIPIVDVTIAQINAFLNSLRDDYSNSDITKIFSSLSLAYDLAIDDEIVNSNLMKNKKVIKPKSNKEDKKVKAFSQEEQRKFLDALKEYVPKGGTRGYYKAQMYIELLTGMRMGEINGLKLEDVDLEKKEIHIERTITKNENSKAIVGSTTKTYSGVRTIPIPPVLMNVFREAIDNYIPNPYNLLFIRKDNLKPIPTAAVNCSYKRICEKYHLPNHGQHSLRHTYATRYIENMNQSENKLVVLSRLLGHKDITTTINTYADVLLAYQMDVVREMFETSDMFKDISL